MSVPVPPCSSRQPEPGGPSASARPLLAAPVFAEVVHTVLDARPDLDRDRAERIVDEALKFVVAAARFPLSRLVPTPEVDTGWHALILHTRAYRALCSWLGHHVDHWPEGTGPGVSDPGAPARTVELIRRSGYVPDPELWCVGADVTG
ncbi:hypothetical protein ACN20G_03725 [Streptomyces sp. BI20]|uniref:hypothetical protein n=1 Tax=Streptomyces sp. BI20 TaxID=3403460 RepID=UPI003C77C2C9